MKTKINQILFPMTMAIFFSMKVFSQPGTLTLTFTGDNNGQAVSLESVVVKNLTQNCDTTLYPPDLTLVIDTIMTGIANPANSGNDFEMSQNFPNPFTYQTAISIFIPEKDYVEISVNNLLGQQLAHYSGQLSHGNNTFVFFPGNESIYLMSVNYKKITKTIRMLSSGSGVFGKCQLKYSGTECTETYKSMLFKSYFDFNLGDLLLFVGQTSLGESGILDSPEENEDYIFQFATNIPCIGSPTVLYEGQTYNTIQIFSQCWLKENLNVGNMVLSSQLQTNNNVVEKYCMGDMASLCDLFGGLYFWNEMMKYTNETGGQGICPDGWHVPDDKEWQILEGAVDSVYSIGHQQWGSSGWRGSDAGGNLKQEGTLYWEPPNTGATNAFGFTVLPAGYFVQNSFWGAGYKTYLWSSSYPQKHFRNLDWNQPKINRSSGGDEAAISVRCIKD